MKNIYLVVVSDAWQSYESMQVVSLQLNKKTIEENYKERVKVNQDNNLDDVVSLYQLEPFHDFSSDLLQNAEIIKSSINDHN